MADVEIVTLPNPYVMDWKNWADFVVGYNPGLISRLDPEVEWREFARRFVEAVPQAPSPDTFESWRDWAASLKQVLQL